MFPSTDTVQIRFRHSSHADHSFLILIQVFNIQIQSRYAPDTVSMLITHVDVPYLGYAPDTAAIPLLLQIQIQSRYAPNTVAMLITHADVP